MGNNIYMFSEQSGTFRDGVLLGNLLVSASLLEVCTPKNPAGRDLLRQRYEPLPAKRS